MYLPIEIIPKSATTVVRRESSFPLCCAPTVNVIELRTFACWHYEYEKLIDIEWTNASDTLLRSLMVAVLVAQNDTCICLHFLSALPEPLIHHQDPNRWRKTFHIWISLHIAMLWESGQKSVNRTASLQLRNPMFATHDWAHRIGDLLEFIYD